MVFLGSFDKLLKDDSNMDKIILFIKSMLMIKDLIVSIK